MSDNVRVLPTPKIEENKVAVELLEEMLTFAKQGKIRDFAATVIFADGTTGSYMPLTSQSQKLIGGMFILMHDMADAAIALGGQIETPTEDDPA